VKVARWSLAVATLLGVAGSAYADFDGGPLPGHHALTDLSGSTLQSVIAARSQGYQSARSTRACPRELGAGLWAEHDLALDPLGAGLRDGYAGGSPAEAAEQHVQQLPPGPGSAGLFLSALLTVGAYHVVRSARQMHLSDLPTWYHADGPGQVGHAVAIDMQFVPLAACSFDEPVGERPVCSFVQRESRSRCESQSFLATEAPRGPPLLSS